MTTTKIIGMFAIISITYVIIFFVLKKLAEFQKNEDEEPFF